MVLSTVKHGKRILSGLSLCAVGLALSFAKPASAQQVYFNDFEKVDLRGWFSDSSTVSTAVYASRTPGTVAHPSTVFLGNYGGNPNINYSGIGLNLPLTGALPSHTWIRSEWLLESPYILSFLRENHTRHAVRSLKPLATM